MEREARAWKTGDRVEVNCNEAGIGCGEWGWRAATIVDGHLRVMFDEPVGNSWDRGPWNAWAEVLRPLAASPPEYAVGARVEVRHVGGGKPYGNWLPGRVTISGHYVEVGTDNGGSWGGNADRDWFSSAIRPLREEPRPEAPMTWEAAKAEITKLLPEAWRRVDFYDGAEGYEFYADWWEDRTEVDSIGVGGATPAALVAAVREWLGKQTPGAPASVPAPPRARPLDPSLLCSTCGGESHLVARQRHECLAIECAVERVDGCEVDGRRINEATWLASGSGRRSLHPLRHVAIAMWRASK